MPFPPSACYSATPWFCTGWRRPPGSATSSSTRGNISGSTPLRSRSCSTFGRSASIRATSTRSLCWPRICKGYPWSSTPWTGSRNRRLHVKIALIVILVVVVVALAAGSKYYSVRNDLVTQRNGMDAAWSDVEVVLQRRADLIPNLVETVKGFAKHDTEVFKDIADARAALIGGRTPQEKIQANDQLSGALSRLLVISENYPQLRSNENFLRLQDEIAGTENRIAVERRKYNEVLQRYNTSIELFP